MSNARTPAAEYLRFLAWALATVVLVAALGFVPTRRLGGEEALAAMIAGCAVGWAASALGGIPVALGRGSRGGTVTPAARLQAMLMSMALRFGVVIVLGAAAAFSGWFGLKPLLIWIAVSYLALLAVDTWYAVKGF
ncbi:MAG TPA: hypothetical protein VHC97_22545 [Thermoanaerobaculia bacterium]|jgi:hypothetical protein|nr:hypothetical protein [Thermoanaerobaculia bacterium]